MTPLLKYNLVVLFFILPFYAVSQQRSAVVNLAPIDGTDITPDNVFNYSIQSTFERSVQCKITGIIRYRDGGLRMSYSLDYNLKPGVNNLFGESLHPQWQFSTSALKELFSTHRMLPKGIYEYCVSVQTFIHNPEMSIDNDFEDCIFHKGDDVFLINLVDPEDKAKLYETNPLLAWMVNSPLASMLTYRIRIAEMKNGQNKINAVNRNNPVYTERNLSQTSITYPVYAKPLKKYQPYAWTVDAYYKNILLGGAEPWEFMIIEDSLMKSEKMEVPYVDVKLETENVQLMIAGSLRLKYNLEDANVDTLQLNLRKKNGSEIKIDPSRLIVNYGENRYDIDLKNNYNLPHGSAYVLTITTLEGKQYTIPFKYLNPDFINKQ